MRQNRLYSNWYFVTPVLHPAQYIDCNHKLRHPTKLAPKYPIEVSPYRANIPYDLYDSGSLLNPPKILLKGWKLPLVLPVRGPILTDKPDVRLL